MSQNSCMCGSGKIAQVCCQPYLSGALIPNRPEQLMRSRYSAFCQGNIDYLIATHHPSKRKADDQKTLADTVNQTEWLGLKVLAASEPAKAESDTSAIGFVEFVAFYRGDKVEQLHEKSMFIQEEGRWYYVDGEMLESISFGRNESCWCGSHKKYKRCHGSLRA